MTIFLWAFTAGLLSISLIKDFRKTKQALKIATKKFSSVFLIFILVLAGFALLITFVPPELIREYLGTESGMKGVMVATGLGSISVMPGFAAFPLCAALRMEGIPYYIIAAFSITLMNVGIVTFPLEKKFLGLKVALLRNGLALIVSLITVICIKFLFGE
ncbi:MAG: hypothetical protein SCALA702_12060 [Melioribacteraceae bacterium]|nr:MAG: hypothetical protein SCALA702_12060 [Melioribacteraceae bacterium]